MDANTIAEISTTVAAIAAIGPIGWVLGGLFAISEIMPYITKIKANGLLDAVTNLVKKK